MANHYYSKRPLGCQGDCWLTPTIDVRPLTDFTSSGSAHLATARDGRPRVVAHDGTPGTHDLYYLDLTQGSTSYYHVNGQAVAQRDTDLLQEESHVHYLHRDRLGSLTEVTDEDKNVIGRARYDAYGRILSNTIPLTLTTRLYAWSDYDPETGLYKIGARWYDPQLGVWLTPDSVVPDVNNPLAWNPYAFNYQNPVQYVDPSGHWVESVLDLVGFGMSLRDFWQNPSLGNAFWLGLDAVSLAVPFVTFAWARRAGDVGDAGRVAYLIGGMPQDIQGVEQILELSSKYDEVVVNDLFPHIDEMIEMYAEQAGYILPKNIRTTVGNAANLPQLDYTDIFAVAPDLDFHRDLVRVAENVLGGESRLIIASNLEAANDLGSVLRKRNLNVAEEFFGSTKAATIVQVGSREVGVTSFYFRLPGRHVPGRKYPMNTLMIVTR